MSRLIGFVGQAKIPPSHPPRLPSLSFGVGFQPKMASQLSSFLPSIHDSLAWRNHPSAAPHRSPLPISLGLGFTPLSSHNAAAAARIKENLCAGSRRGAKVIAMATGETEPSAVVTNFFEGLQETWEKTDDKLAIGGLGFAALIVLWGSAGLISAIDKLPFLPAIFEFIGILFTGWFVYRYLLFKPDREELVKTIEDAKQKITGQ